MGWLAQGQSHFEESGSCPPPCHQSLKLVLQLKYFLVFWGCMCIYVWCMEATAQLCSKVSLGTGPLNPGIMGEILHPTPYVGQVGPNSGSSLLARVVFQVLKFPHPSGLGLFFPLFIFNFFGTGFRYIV